MSIEVVELDNVRYAEIIWAGASVETTRFFSPASASFQFGLLAHPAGFVELAHTHKVVPREISDLPQFFVVQRGAVAVSFYRVSGDLFREVVLRAGDAIVLLDGAHSVRVLEDMQCLTVKQGPFLGAENDKVPIKTNS
jgi:hypothetical protein